ncbi:MAG: hypothetical protein JJU16_06780 [Alkalibacterium sp.]|nr:hypothetical protein [Alkalibacterium sp.]
MSSKYKEFFESSKKHRPAVEEKGESLSFKDSYPLPKDLKRKEDIKQEFKEYLTHKDEEFTRSYIKPPFEVSKVPSPVYGFKKRTKTIEHPVDYLDLKNKMRKETHEFLTFEPFVTPELEDKWNVASILDDKVDRSTRVKITKAKTGVRENNKKTNGLHRTLASIMEDERSGSHSERIEVPGFFNNER